MPDGIIFLNFTKLLYQFPKLQPKTTSVAEHTTKLLTNLSCFLTSPQALVFGCQMHHQLLTNGLNMFLSSLHLYTLVAESLTEH